MNDADSSRLVEYLFRIALALEAQTKTLVGIARSVEALADSDLERLRTRRAVADLRRDAPPSPTDPPKEDGE